MGTQTEEMIWKLKRKWFLALTLASLNWNRSSHRTEDLYMYDLSGTQWVLTMGPPMFGEIYEKGTVNSNNGGDGQF